jgi:hypothetical protein
METLTTHTLKHQQSLIIFAAPSDAGLGSLSTLKFFSQPKNHIFLDFYGLFRSQGQGKGADNCSYHYPPRVCTALEVTCSLLRKATFAGPSLWSKVGVWNWIENTPLEKKFAS